MTDINNDEYINNLTGEIIKNVAEGLLYKVYDEVFDEGNNKRNTMQNKLWGDNGRRGS